MTPEILRILGECFGAAAIAEGFCIYCSRTRQRILIFKVISDLLWCCNYLCLGNLTGALLNVVGMTRETVFYLRDKKKFFASPLWLLLFLIATAASPTYSLLSGKEGLLALLPAAGSTLSTVGFYQQKPQRIRVIGLAVQTLWLLYSLFSHNLTATVGNTVMIVSSLAGMQRAAAVKKAASSESSGDSLPRPGK